jgi:hypothetical protein
MHCFTHTRVLVREREAGGQVNEPDVLGVGFRRRRDHERTFPPRRPGPSARARVCGGKDVCAPGLAPRRRVGRAESPSQPAGPRARVRACAGEAVRECLPALGSFLRYEEVPSHIAQKLIDEAKKAKEAVKA